MQRSILGCAQRVLLAFLFSSVAIACNSYDADKYKPGPTGTAGQAGGGMATAGNGGEGGAAGTAGESGSGGAGSGAEPGCVPNPNVDDEVCPFVCPEVCNGGDDDCDRRIDEDADKKTPLCDLANANAACIQGDCRIVTCTDNYRDCDNEDETGCEVAEDDINHCGQCNKKCSFPNGVAACVSKQCVRVGCNSGWDDCDANGNDCETSTVTLTNCGGCDVSCGPLDNATASCDMGSCTPTDCATLFGDCNLIAADGCEEPLDSMVNCGECAQSCDFTGSTDECRDGVCLATTCDTDYADCDGDMSNGCESLVGGKYCGSCDVICDAAALPRVVATGCGQSGCEITQCSAGYANCDGDTQNGCETALGTLNNCGACGDACVTDNGVPQCVQSQCGIKDCEPGYGDCQNGAADGCETKLDSLTHCGECGETCGLAGCAGGVCSICTAGNNDCGSPPCADCDTNAATCEASLISLQHCGACNNRCELAPGVTNAHGTLSCAPTGCAVTCEPGYANCNGDYRDGCEVALNTVNNCNGCGNVCSIPNAQSKCTTQSGGNFLCEVDTCNPDFADCNNDKTSCETAVNTTANCGTCGNACNLPNAVESCVGTPGARSCAFTTCEQAYHKNCDNMTATGCEVDTRSDAKNCGACGNDCTDEPNIASASCVSGMCDYDCSTGFGDCTSDPGCETDFTTLTDCAGCGVACMRANGMASCESGTCELIGCEPDFDECNDNDDDGCESLNTNTDCGSCGAFCGAANGTAVCNAGTCSLTACNDGFEDCDGELSTGCERNTRSVAMGGEGPCVPDQNCTRLTHGGHTYWFCANARSWSAARAQCTQQLGGDLVRINDQAENDFVQASLTTDAWIGANDVTTEGTWRWSDNNDQFWNGVANGNAVGGRYNRWGTGEPNDSGSNEDCAHAIAATGRWNDQACTSAMAFVCETQPDTCPMDPLKTSPGTCGCGVPDVDTDGDLAFDCVDACPNNPQKWQSAGACGCNMADTDGDMDGTLDCQDGCPTDAGKTAPGVCGCNVSDADSDGDGTPDCNDECPGDPGRTVGPCGFPYTPSNFVPSELTFAANVTVNCDVTLTSGAAVTAPQNICGTMVTPVVRTQGGSSVWILPMQSLTVEAGRTLKLNGSLPVILAIVGSATVNGKIDASSASATTLGAGANVACPPGNGGAGGWGQSNVACGATGGMGGGGGGFGLAGMAGGANGGCAGTTGAGGAANGLESLVPLRGGCRGGTGAATNNGTSAGGNGGGAVQISATSVTLASTAVVTASGGGGVKGTGEASGGGGGGSGGAVLIEGATVSIHASAWITANGGSGASNTVNGNNGVHNNKTNAAGVSGSGRGGSSGRGGAADGAAAGGSDGGWAWIGAGGGGGGGGGVGRTRVRTVGGNCESIPIARFSPGRTCTNQ